MTWNPCKDPRCPHPGELTPEDPDKLQGPDVGELMVYIDPNFSRWHGTIVRVLKRSYVWSPEAHMPTGYHGYRHYDWSVIETDVKSDGIFGRMVVDDDKLEPVILGTLVALNAGEESVVRSYRERLAE
jgi:hypothetical protein